MASKLMEYFNRQPRLGVLSTSNKAGEVNAAYFGSPCMMDETTVLVALGRNKTLENLRENPQACYLIMEPGKSVFDWKGLRIYLKVAAIETSGEKLEKMKAQISEKAGKSAAKMIHAVVIFTITGVRSLVDFGQEWEKSI